MTETRRRSRRAARGGFGTIVSARSGESEDVTIVHLAVGWGAGQLKVGSFSRSERMAKWNEVLRIEEALGDRAAYAGGAALASRPDPAAKPQAQDEGRRTMAEYRLYGFGESGNAYKAR